MSDKLLQTLVFTSGAAVMAVEMTGLRLLAPHFGTSLLVTTVLIGTLMGFLALGYRLGGRAADRYPTLQALSRVTLVASGLILLIPLIGRPMLDAAGAVIRPLVSGGELSEPRVAVATIIGGALGVLGLMAGPVTLMGMVSPWAIRLSVTNVEGSGAAAGRLYALSTFGSIIGSFLPALVLVPALGVQRTYLAVGAVFALVSALGAFKGAAKAVPPAVAAALMLLPPGSVRSMAGVVEERESIYHFIQVVEEPYGACKKAAHLYLNEGVGVHSVKCTEPGKETRGSWTYMAAAALWLDEPARLKNALIIGLAGGTIARQLLEVYPEAHVDGVEIDGAIVEVGKQYFDLDDSRIRPVVMDGRVFLQADAPSYDLILIDAYRQPYIPFHLVTVEFFGLVAAHMTEDAVLAVNVASVRGVSQSLAGMIYKTMRAVFPQVIVVHATQSNDILIATTKVKPMGLGPEHLDATPSAVAFDTIRKRLPKRVVAEIEGWEQSQLLTDDDAPVEMAWDLMAIDYAR